MNISTALSRLSDHRHEASRPLSKRPSPVPAAHYANLRWFEVLRTSGHIDAGQPRHYQVTLKVGFTMEAPPLP